MAGFWPLYSNFVSKSQVTLALPGKPSNISKSVGGNFPALLLIPNVDFLIAFIQGNIGIADSMSKAALLKNINGPIASNNEMVTRHFSKVNGLGLEDKLDTFKDSKGKIKIPKSEIKLSTENDQLGFKAMEKTILTSIFETQKPYMEIAKMVIEVLVAVEDIVARIMPLISASPLTAKSDKPVGNGGSGKRPAAIGFQGGKKIKEAIAALDKLSKIGGKVDVNKDGTTTNNGAGAKGTTLEDVASDLSILQNERLKEMGKSYKIIDVKYSTGSYDPTVNYLYEYIDLPADDSIDGKQPTPDDDDDDPYNKYKPKKIILGIFDSKGVPLDPNSKLFTINQYFDPNQPQRLQGKTLTNFSKADWITRSPKWVFPNSTSPTAYVWPSFGTPIYRWERLGGVQQKESKTEPEAGNNMPSWEKKKYKKGQKNEISGFDAIEGDPVIAGFDPTDLSVYTTYFTEYTTINMGLAKDLEQAEKDESIKTIMSQLNVKSHLENVSLYAQSKSTFYKDFPVPEGMKVSFKPMQITIEAARKDPKLAGLDGKIWIDPESDYDTKIIQVKPATKIAYSGAKGDTDVQVEIDSFVKNNAIIKFSNNDKFNIDISKNNGVIETFKYLDQYMLENWNYSPSTRQIQNANRYVVTLWSDKPSGKIGDFLNSGSKLVMGRNTNYNEHGDYQITIEYSNGSYLYSEKYYSQNGALSNKPFSDGIKKIGDGSIVLVKNKKITKWYFVHEKVFNEINLPLFGNESTMVFNLNRKVDVYKNIGNLLSYKEPMMSSSNGVIPLYQIKVSNNSFPYGKIIDPSKVMNNQLTGDALFSTGKYGSGSTDDPQELGTVYRYAKTDLDDETYYIIEGIRVDENVQIDSAGGDNAGSASNGNAGAGAGGGSYRLPHAIGAITVFIKMLVKVFSKLIPAIVKLLKLFKNPVGFVTDIVMEKLGESFSVFNKDSIKKFDNAKDLIKQKKKFNKPQPPAIPGEPTPMVPKMGDYVNMMRNHFMNSKLKNHVAVDSLGNFKDASGKIPKVPPKDAIGNFKFVYDGVGFIPFTIFGKDLSFGLELKMANVITKEWGNPLPMRLVFKKPKDSKDPNNLKVNGPGTDDGNNSNSKDAANKEVETNSDINKNQKNSTSLDKDNDKKYVTISTWYSTGEFLNGVDYKYIYVDQEDQSLLDEVDRLSDSIDPADLQEAKRKLEDAIVKDPEDDALKNKLDEIKKKIFDLNSNTQPLLKMILGIVTLPIKVIAGIIQWIMDFFKSLTNPMALPGKILELLSFKWIMKFFSPKGLLTLAGIEFDLSLIPQWIAQAKQTKAGASDAASAAKAKAGETAGQVKGKAGETAAQAKDAKGKAKDVSPNDAKAAAQEKIPPLPKGVPNHKGSYALPDDFEIADLPKFLSVSFLGQLPSYTVRDMREQGKKIPLRLFQPIICFIEKLINGFIDFVWATLGIECIIPPPHIKLCSSDDPEAMDTTELAKILNGETPGGGTASSDVDFKTEVVATDPEYSEQEPVLEKYVYEVQLENGETKRFLDRESLDKFTEENRNIGFDFQF